MKLMRGKHAFTAKEGVVWRLRKAAEEAVKRATFWKNFGLKASAIPANMTRNRLNIRRRVILAIDSVRNKKTERRKKKKK